MSLTLRLPAKAIAFVSVTSAALAGRLPLINTRISNSIAATPGFRPGQRALNCESILPACLGLVQKQRVVRQPRDRLASPNNLDQRRTFAVMKLPFVWIRGFFYFGSGTDGLRGSCGFVDRSS